MATDTMSLVEKCQELTREHGGKVSTALATLMLACQMNVANAQTTLVNPADSAIATAAKGLEYGQYTKDGRKFEYLKPEDVKGLSRVEKEQYYAWKDHNLNTKLITTKQEADLEGAGRITTKQEADLEGAGRITEYQKMIMNFTILHNTGTRASIYFTMKEELKKVLLSGKPPEILQQLELLRPILMS